MARRDLFGPPHSKHRAPNGCLRDALAWQTLEQNLRLPTFVGPPHCGQAGRTDSLEALAQVVEQNRARLLSRSNGFLQCSQGMLTTAVSSTAHSREQYFFALRGKGDLPQRLQNSAGLRLAMSAHGTEQNRGVSPRRRVKGLAHCSHVRSTIVRGRIVM